MMNYPNDHTVTSAPAMQLPTRPASSCICSSCIDLDAERIRLQGLNISLAARIAAASEVLGKVAEKGGAAELAVRFLIALEEIAIGDDGNGVTTLEEARGLAAEAAWIRLPGKVLLRDDKQEGEQR